MSILFSLGTFDLLLHLLITTMRSCAAVRAVLDSHDTNVNAPLNLSVANVSFTLPVLADSDSPDKRGAEEHFVAQIVWRFLIVALILCLVYSMARVVIKQTGVCAGLRLRFNVPPAFTKISTFFAQHFQSPSPSPPSHNPSFLRSVISHMVALSLRYTIRYIRRNALPAPVDASLLPLHQLDHTPSSPPLEHVPSPASPPRVLFHNPHEPHRASSQSPRISPSSAFPHSASQTSLAASEAASEATYLSGESDATTVVQEPMPGRAFW